MTPAEFPTTPTQERDMDLTQITTPFGLLDDDERRQTTAEASSFLSHMARRKNGTPVNEK